MNKTTDWTAYYQSTPRYTKVTRAISTRKLLGLIKPEGRRGPINVCELGGANSCFVDAICNEVPVDRYHVVDMNEFGLSLLESKSPRCNLTHEMSDATQPYESDEQFDLVFSVGLIEHFGPEGTREVVKTHFSRCRSGGLVLVTFPTPTWLYRAARVGAETVGAWSFPDERPLGFEEVEANCSEWGAIEHRSINWPIILTQGYVTARAR